MTRPPQPEVQQADLDADTVRQLFEDVAAHTELIAVTLKGGATEHAQDDAVPLAEAQALLEAGEVRGVQIRYRHEGVQWWDTLMHTASGIRLVRIRHDFRDAPITGS